MNKKKENDNAVLTVIYMYSIFAHCEIKRKHKSN